MIDLGKARKRLRPGELGETKRPKILDTLDRAEEALRRIIAGCVKQAELGREWGVSRARITQMVKLARLSPEVLEWVRAHAWTVRVGERRLRAVQDLPKRLQLEALRHSVASADPDEQTG